MTSAHDPDEERATGATGGGETDAVTEALGQLGLGGDNAAVGIAMSGLSKEGRLARVLHRLGVAELVVGVLLITLILFLVLIQVAQRYLPGGNWVWTGEIARFSLVWATLAMSGYLMAHDQHITLEMIDYVASPRVLSLIKRSAHVIVFLIAVAMTFESYQLISDRSGQVSPATRMPLTWVYILPFLGFIFTALRAAVATFAEERANPAGPTSDEVDRP